MTDTRRRVKLYALNAERQWDDRGTGHVSSSYVDRLKGISLLVRAEADGALLLESKIQPDTAYQKQQCSRNMDIECKKDQKREVYEKHVNSHKE
uniref:PP4R3 EVH1-like domain-containing protein n=1 Tax=Timema shepardi TaxID=629360 RepID=A0A7R9FVP4_TIMSH|nr:unnamed protein product [Timema shepardi]